MGSTVTQRVTVSHLESHSTEMNGTLPEQRKPAGTSLASEAAQLRRGEVRAQASWSEASGSFSHLAPVSLVLFTANWQPATSKPRARFSRHRMFQVPCTHD